MNQTIISGNLGSDVELRYTQNGDAVANFRVAVNDRVNRGGQWVDETTWYRVTVWGKRAETCNEYLRKGSKVLVTGKVKADAYIAKDGTARASLELTARDVEFLSGREERGGSSSEVDGADIPF